MNKETKEISEFENLAELNKEIELNPSLVEVKCDKLCNFREKRGEKVFCGANRFQRRLIKCQIKKNLKMA